MSTVEPQRREIPWQPVPTAVAIEGVTLTQNIDQIKMICLTVTTPDHTAKYFFPMEVWMQFLEVGTNIARQHKLGLVIPGIQMPFGNVNGADT